MTRRALLLMPLLIARRAGGVSPSDEFLRRALEVEKHWDVFIRRLFGCKPAPEPTNSENCRPQFGEIDYAAFTRWTKAARKLMGE